MNNSTMSPGTMPRREHIYGHENLQDISNPAVTSARADSSMSPDGRPMNVTAVLSYLDAIKTQFRNEPDVYNNFLDIMKDYKSQM
jgi:histone deacetylase complex regulatory component SIN3